MLLAKERRYDLSKKYNIKNMSLNYKTIYLDGSSTVSVFEAPRVMRRIFLGIYLVARGNMAFTAHISFDDPEFVNYITLNSLKTEYEFECADIPQGIVFVQKQSDVVGSISAIEILK